MKKRILFSVTSLILMISLLAVFPALSASAEISPDGKYEYEVLDNGNIKLTLYKGNGGDITVPKSINGRNVTMIGDYCFDEWRNGGIKNLTSVILPEGIKIVDRYAFSSCDNLETVQFPRSISSVNEWFSYCPKVTIKIYPGSKAYNYITEIDNNVPYKLIGVTDLSKGKVTNLSVAYTYTGKQIRPNVIVKYGSYILRKGIDYSIVYNNNSRVGLASLVITGKGLFKGSITKYFYVRPKAQAVTYLNSGKRGYLTIGWNKDTQVNGYVLQYARNASFTYGRMGFNITNNAIRAKAFTRLAPGKRYYVRVVSYRNINGKRLYGSWSKVKSIVIRQ